MFFCRGLKTTIAVRFMSAEDAMILIGIMLMKTAGAFGAARTKGGRAAEDAFSSHFFLLYFSKNYLSTPLSENFEIFKYRKHDFWSFNSGFEKNWIFIVFSGINGRQIGKNRKGFPDLGLFLSISQNREPAVRLSFEKARFNSRFCPAGTVSSVFGQSPSFSCSE